MTLRGAGLAAGVTLAVTVGAGHALAALLLSQRYEDWQAKRATGSLYPRSWDFDLDTWTGLPR